MAIYDPRKPSDFDVEKLHTLTKATRDSHIVHTIDGVWGDRSMYSFDPLPETNNALARVSFFRDPGSAPKDGDVLEHFSGGRKESLLFDVRPVGNPPDLWEAHCTPNKPDSGIGHAVTSHSRKDRLEISKGERPARVEKRAEKPHVPERVAAFADVARVVKAADQGTPVTLTVNMSGGAAFDATTEARCHPRDAKDGCVGFVIGNLPGDAKAKVWLVHERMPGELTQRWNGKKDGVVVSGIEISPESHPEVFNGKIGGMHMRPDERVVLVKSLEFGNG